MCFVLQSTVRVRAGVAAVHEVHDDKIAVKKYWDGLGRERMCHVSRREIKLIDLSGCAAVT